MAKLVNTFSSNAKKIARKLSVTVFAGLVILVSAVVQARDYSMVLGSSLGPYVTPDGRGMLTDIILASAAVNGDKVNFSYTSNVGALQAFGEKKFDSIGVTRPEGDGVFYSDVVIRFQNIAVSLEKSRIDLKNMYDLYSYKVIGFSGAHRFMGKKFRNAIETSANYSEIVNQAEQVRRLLSGETEVIIIDRFILYFYVKQLVNSGLVNDSNFENYVEHEIFPLTEYAVGFHSESDRDSFNQGLRKIRENGTYDRIISRYENLLKSY